MSHPFLLEEGRFFRQDEVGLAHQILATLAPRPQGCGLRLEARRVSEDEKRNLLADASGFHPIVFLNSDAAR